MHRVHLLGHSHGGFVAQFHAPHRPDQVAGVVLYESDLVTGGEFGEEMMCRVGEFAARHADRQELQEVMEAFASIPGISDDEAMVSVARGIVPAYVADYWADAQRWGELQEALRATYISGRDEHGEPDLVDDREVLDALRVPTLVVAGSQDVVCGVRWAEELHKLIPASQLLILERSGHFGHLEEPEVLKRRPCPPHQWRPDPPHVMREPFREPAHQALPFPTPQPRYCYRAAKTGPRAFPRAAVQHSRPRRAELGHEPGPSPVVTP